MRAGRLSWLLPILLVSAGCSAGGGRITGSGNPDGAGGDGFVPPRTDPLPPVSANCTHFVAPGGDDDGGGGPAAPWRTLKRAASSAKPGNVVCARAGVYAGAVVIEVSGTQDAPIVFRSFPGETAIVDGGGLSPSSDEQMFLVEGRSWITIAGFEIRNLRTTRRGTVAGFWVTDGAHHVQIRDNDVHHIETRAGSDGNAHGIAIHQHSDSASIHDVAIDGNKVHDLKLGASEAVVVNGNVTAWQITNNEIHDNDNIGIDAIGYEGTGAESDRAREGTIAGNLVYANDSFGNPAYGSSRSAGCIYVDGGAKIVIERNVVRACNIGIEIASERGGKYASDIVVRSNFISANTEAGISLGGASSSNGGTERCSFVNNTLFQNDTRNGGTGEIQFQYNTRDNVLKNNLFFASKQGLFIGSSSNAMSGNVVDSNLYWTAGGGEGSWKWKGKDHDTVTAYRAATGNDAASIFAVDPLLVDDTGKDLHLRRGSMAANKGAVLAASGSVDIDGDVRQKDATDIGADELR